jgi:hypothetical protein
LNSSSNLLNNNLNGGGHSLNNLNGNLRQSYDEVNVTIRRNEKGFGFEVCGGTRITKVNQSRLKFQKYLLKIII